MEYQILCTKAKEYASTRKQNEALRDEVNRLRRILRNNGLDPDAVLFSERLVGLANYVSDNDYYGANLPAGVAYDTTGAEQSLVRTSVAAPSARFLMSLPLLS
uniref:Uncharacterized protein n=1 Tax=Nelumbo nucifera TaxID=4432 RepID=A0A822XN96_NELNU|nr:TPA_asm: hypothetical protein HUJ06_022124 [Nelumbo nucifera]